MLEKFVIQIIGNPDICVVASWNLKAIYNNLKSIVSSKISLLASKIF